MAFHRGRKGQPSLALALRIADVIPTTFHLERKDGTVRAMAPVVEIAVLVCHVHEAAHKVDFRDDTDVSPWAAPAHGIHDEAIRHRRHERALLHKDSRYLLPRVRVFARAQNLSRLLGGGGGVRLDYDEGAEVCRRRRRCTPATALSSRLLLSPQILRIVLEAVNMFTVGKAVGAVALWQKQPLRRPQPAPRKLHTLPPVAHEDAVQVALRVCPGVARAVAKSRHPLRRVPAHAMEVDGVHTSATGADHDLLHAAIVAVCYSFCALDVAGARCGARLRQGGPG